MRHGASSRHMGEPRPAAGVEPGLLAAGLAMALLLMACVCSIESGPCERVESLQMSGRF